MASLTAQRTPLLLSLGILLLIAAGIAFSATLATDSVSVLIFWSVLGGLTALLFYAVKGDLLVAVLIWFITLIALHEEFWRVSVPLFFALTIPRIGLVVLALLLLAMIALGRVPVRHAWPVSGYMLALATYFFASALVSGFETRSVVTVHYRLIGGYIFPFVVFGLVLHAFRHERDFRRLATFFMILSVYLTLTGWCERFKLNALIFPRFISDPSIGIHYGRVRGPFVLSPAMGLALCYCFFNNLVLARNNRSVGRWWLLLLNAAMLPPIFWTYTRSVWLSFVLCLMIWAMYSQRRATRVIIVSLLIALVLVVGVVNMGNFMSDDRSKGGLTDTEPILLRIGLAQMTWEIVKEHPFFGVGFGHFRDHAPNFARDPSSPFYAFGTTALEHNNMLSIVAETGIVGITLYLLTVIALVRFSIQLYRKLPRTSPRLIGPDLLVLYWILAMAYFIDGTFRETSDNPFANSLFFGLSAVPVALNELLSPSPLRRSSDPAARARSGGRPRVPPRPNGLIAGAAPAARGGRR